LTVTAENLGEAVEKLKQHHVGLVVMVNKYDGIDLPGNACRILVLDGLPQSRRLYERVETTQLAGSEHIISRQIQRIEQGMGRGIRGNDDHCAVILMGPSLIKTMFLIGAKQRFSPATRAQFEKSLEIAGQLDDGITELDTAVELILSRNLEWKKVSREALANIVYPIHGSVRPIAVAQRLAFDSAAIRDYKEAQRLMQEVVHQSNGEMESIQGWLKWQLAEYVQLTDPVQAQQILKAALQLNRRLTRPIDGMGYQKLEGKDLHQAREIAWKLKSYAGKPNNLLIHVNGILDDLNFIPDNATVFESAMEQLGDFLGYLSQRPEVEFKSGPDVLWAVGNLQYFVIECKSGAVVDNITKTYANQLSGSMNWFGKRYDHTVNVVAVLVHPSRVFEHAATPHPTARIITAKTLPLLKDAVSKFAKALAASVDKIDAAEVQKLLTTFNLTPTPFLANYTEEPKG
jgi:hypothetical protein